MADNQKSLIRQLAELAIRNMINDREWWEDNPNDQTTLPGPPGMASPNWIGPRDTGRSTWEGPREDNDIDRFELPFGLGTRQWTPQNYRFTDEGWKPSFDFRLFQNVIGGTPMINPDYVPSEGKRYKREPLSGTKREKRRRQGDMSRNKKNKDYLRPNEERS